MPQGRDKCGRDLQIDKNGQTIGRSSDHQLHTWMLVRSFGDTSVLELAFGEKICQTDGINELFGPKDLNNLITVKNVAINFGLITDLERCAAPKAITSVGVFICAATETARFILIL
jgi:hypothetical protein